MVKETNRRRTTSRKQAKNPCGKTLKEQIQQIKKTKKGLSSEAINRLTNCSPNFIGCFSEDVLPTLTFQQKPCFLIVNLDKTGMPGSHWIALGIFDEKIEVFDSLGFRIFKWPRIPCNLLRFLHCHSTRRKLVISSKLQNNTKLCGIYCIHYVLNRPFMSLSKVYKTIHF